MALSIYIMWSVVHKPPRIEWIETISLMFLFKLDCFARSNKSVAIPHRFLIDTFYALQFFAFSPFDMVLFSFFLSLIHDYFHETGPVSLGFLMFKRLHILISL